MYRWVVSTYIDERETKGNGVGNGEGFRRKLIPLRKNQTITDEVN